MNNRETLLIIDMQPAVFMAAKNQETIKEVVKEVRKARKRGIGIVVLEFEMDPVYVTAIEIMEALSGYERYTVYLKDDDDGSDQAILAANHLKASYNKWRVCGVNTNCCVMETVFGLLDEDCKVKLVRRACNSEDENPWEEIERVAEYSEEQLQLV